jgi:hypothetical protein
MNDKEQREFETRWLCAILILVGIVCYNIAINVRGPI